MGNRVYVWDWPLRLFHWLLVLAIVAAYLTQYFGAMDWHQRIGLTVIGLIVFRLVWGFVGTRHARFAEFVRGPAGVLAYLRGEWRGFGHTPLGGWSVLLLLLLPLAMAASGLFANDDIAFAGLLSGWVNKSVSDQLTSLHYLGFNLLLGLIGLHLAAIAFYRLKRRVDLVRPMLTGWKEAREAPLDVQDSPNSAMAGGVALAFALLVAAAAVSGVVALQPAPPPPAAATAAPDW
jgi:cytochrome b